MFVNKRLFFSTLSLPFVIKYNFFNVSVSGKKNLEGSIIFKKNKILKMHFLLTLFFFYFCQYVS